MKKYYISFVYYKTSEWNYGSICLKEKLTEEALRKLQKKLSQELDVKNVVFLMIKELEADE